MFIVNYLSEEKEQKDLLKTFKALDLNNDGRLTKDELLLGYKEHLNLDESEVNRLFTILDANKSGAIDYSEFVSAAIDKERLLSENKLKSAFKLFDRVTLNFQSQINPFWMMMAM